MSATWEDVGRLTAGSMSEQGIVRSPARPRAAATAIVNPSHAWVRPTAERIGYLLALPQNWDSYGAVRIRHSAAEAMVDVLSDLLPPDAIPPTIVPSPAGHLQAEWHVNGVDLEIEVLSSTKVDVLYSDATGQEWNEQFSNDLTLLSEVMRRLRNKTP